LTRAHGDEVVKVCVGELLSIELPANPGGAGFSWSLDAGDLLELVDSGFVQTHEATGSGGMQRWTLRARAQGQSRVGLKYWRPWEGEKSVVDRVEYRVRIRPARK
jgi:predicted secreted protein